MTEEIPEYINTPDPDNSKPKILKGQGDIFILDQDERALRKLSNLDANAEIFETFMEAATRVFQDKEKGTHSQGELRPNE